MIDEPSFILNFFKGFMQGFNSEINFYVESKNKNSVVFFFFFLTLFTGLWEFFGISSCRLFILML